MRLEALLQPVSQAAPAGPDLDLAFDDDYVGYMAEASGRLPQRYFDDRTGAPFDRSSIDVEAEVGRVDRLLVRTRDVRLLTLLARLQIIGGDIIGFCHTLEGLAGIVETFWDHFHPLPFEDSSIERQNSLEGLEDAAQIILPLHYAPLVGTTNALTYRQYLVASGAAKQRPDEAVVSLDAVGAALTAERNAARAAAVYAGVEAGLAALARIREAFISRVGHVEAPKFDRLVDTLKAIRTLFLRYRPDLGGVAPEAGEAEPDEADTPGAASTPAAGSGKARVGSHAEAARALAAAEAHFLRLEPSSPALILVHQARMLIGKPLVDALEALMMENAQHAAFRFDTGHRFDIDLARMKIVTEDALGSADAPDATTDSGAQFNAASRAEASELMGACEQFFRAAEPSSPIPVLLARARISLSKDFSAILAELLPKTDAES